jgi:hypothetical protein
VANTVIEVGWGVADITDHTTRKRAWTSSFFPRLVQRDVPVESRFLGRPQLLTRM